MGEYEVLMFTPEDELEEDGVPLEERERWVDVEAEDQWAAARTAQEEHADDDVGEAAVFARPR